MSQGLLHLHSYLPYIFLPLLIISLLTFWIKGGRKAEFGKSDKQLALFTLIFSHLQLVFGLLLYFIGPKGFQYLSQDGFMKDSVARFYGVEHISVMIIAIVLITMGYSGAKRRAESSAKFRRLAIFYSIGAVLILSRIPWEAWLS